MGPSSPSVQRFSDMKFWNASLTASDLLENPIFSVIASNSLRSFPERDTLITTMAVDWRGVINFFSEFNLKIISSPSIFETENIKAFRDR